MDAALARVIQPNWMPNPDSWVWPLAEGHPPSQGWGRTWRSNPGLANLLWLLLDMGRPPRFYNVRANLDYTSLIFGASGALKPLVELAEVSSLERFILELKARPRLADVGYLVLSDKLIRLADRRLRCVL